MFRKIGRRKLVPYYDRAEIEDGAIAGRGLEICWLKSQTDLLFTQIQGSARVRLEDGSIVRINYDAHNGYPYTPVGRILIERNIIPKEQMSMQRIREWMDANPDGAKELRRQNRSYVFFREVKLSDKDEAVGAQGVPLTPGRSIAVDKALHVYGTPFFIDGELPIESRAGEDAVPPPDDRAGHRLGDRRAGARRSVFRRRRRGRRGGRPDAPSDARFVMLLPNSLDPVARGTHHAAAGAAAVGADRQAVSADGRCKDTRAKDTPDAPPNAASAVRSRDAAAEAARLRAAAAGATEIARRSHRHRHHQHRAASSAR